MKKILVGMLVLVIAGLLVTPAFTEGFLEKEAEVEGTVISAEEVSRELEKAQEAFRGSPTMENARTLQTAYAKYGVTVSDADLALLVEILSGQKGIEKGIEGTIKETGKVLEAKMDKIYKKVDDIHVLVVPNSNLWTIAEARGLDPWAYAEWNKVYPEKGYIIVPDQKLEDYPKDKEKELRLAHLKRRDAWKAKQHNALLLRNEAAREITSKVVPGIEQLKKEHQEQFGKMKEYYEGQIAEIEALGTQMTTEHKAQVAELTRQHKQLEIEMTEQHKAQLEEMTKQHQSQVAQLTEQHRVLAKQHEMLSQQHIAMMEKNKEKVEELDREITLKTQELKEKDQYWQDRLEEITKEYEKKIEKLRVEMASGIIQAQKEFERRLAALEKEKKEKVAVVSKERKEDVAELELTIKNLKDEITSLEKKNADLKDENERLKAELNSIQRQLAAKEKELRLVRLAKQELERRLKEVTRELEELKSQPPKTVIKIETVEVPVEVTVERIIERRTLPAVARLGKEKGILEINSSYLSGVRAAEVRGDFNDWQGGWVIKDSDSDGWLEFNTSRLSPGTYRCSTVQVSEKYSWAQYGDAEQQVPYMKDTSFLFRNENTEEGYCVRFEKLADGSIKPAGNVKR